MAQQRILAIYSNICPIDHKEASFSEILRFGMCEKHFQKLKADIWLARKSLSCDKLGFDKENCSLEKTLNKYIKFFRDIFGFEPFSLNLYWAKKVFRHESFSIMAPTGFGKTTFGISIAHFYPGKVYYLVPSRILLSEIGEKLSQIESSKKVLVIKDSKDKAKIQSGEFDILVTTAHFLHKNYNSLPKDFDLVFIDDADSLIRQPKNIEKVLRLVKVTEIEITKAFEIIDLRRKARTKEDYAQIKDLSINRRGKGIIIAASATLIPRTKRIFLFREILGFEIGQASTHLRNIEETYELVSEKNLWQRSLFWIKKFGQGGFIFLSSIYRLEDLESYITFLENNGIKAISYQKFTPKNRKKFTQGEYQVVVGFSNVRNPLTRGIDLPSSVRYALFVSVPQFKINLSLTESPMQLFLFALTMREFVQDEHLTRELDRRIKFLRKISYLKEEFIKANQSLSQRVKEAKEFLDSLLRLPKVKEEMMKSPRLSFQFSTDGIELRVSDPRGYLQASGRTSRLFPLGLTKGFSLILVENQKIFQHLQEKLILLGYESHFREVNRVNLKSIFRKISRDRNVVKRVIQGEEVAFKNPVHSCLVIVESPTKAKTIAKFFGKPARRLFNGLTVYEISIGNLALNIVASIGHITDLSLKRGFWGVLKTDKKFTPIFQPIKICTNCQRHLDYKEELCPVCKSEEFLTKDDLIKILQRLATEVDFVLLATDPDTEGEKIAFDLFTYLHPYNRNIKRIELHEITRREFLRKLEETREVNFNLVKAQLVRRISDRWIGFVLSQAVQENFQSLALSAGRVQTPVLGWVLSKKERSKEKKYLVFVQVDGNSFFFETQDQNLIQKLRKLIKEKNVHLNFKLIKQEKKELNPLPPYETSEVLKDSALILKLDSTKTMKLLQDLFEQGLITYHRTDSTFISQTGRLIAQEYLKKRNFQKLMNLRSWGNIGTHEGIRPTRPMDVQDLIEEMYLTNAIRLSKNHLRLYGLIFNRFLSSQIKKAKVIWGEGEINLEGLQEIISGPIKLIDPGHLNFYQAYRVLNLEPGKYVPESVSVKRVPVEFPYSQGTLIDEMKKRGLGRPSTYTAIVQTLLSRKYLIQRSGYLIPTKLAEEVYQFLEANYPKFIAEEFTRKLEKTMDRVETGRLSYQKVLQSLFQEISAIDYSFLYNNLRQ